MSKKIRNVKNTKRNITREKKKEFHPGKRISQFSRSYSSYNKVEITAKFQDRYIGNIESISYSISRDMAPIYTMEDEDPRALSRGKQAIAGSIIFSQFDSEPIIEQHLTNGIPSFANTDHLLFSNEVPWVQVPPLDVTLKAENEYGISAEMEINGIELMNSGYGIGVDDIVAEHSYTYIAKSIVPWKRVSS